MNRDKKQTSFSKYIQDLMREGEQLKSTDLFINYLQDFLKQEFNLISPIQIDFQPLLFISDSISVWPQQGQRPLLIGQPPKTPARYLDYKNKSFYLVTKDTNYLNGKILEPKDINLPIYNLKIKPHTGISQKKISSNSAYLLNQKLKVLTISYGVGVLEGLHKAVVQHAHNRKANNISLISHQNISYQLVNNLIQISKLKAVLANCYEQLNAGFMTAMSENVLMYLNDQTHQVVIDSAMQIYGAQSMKAESLPGLAIKRSLALRGLSLNKTKVTEKIKKDLLKKSAAKTNLKNIYSIKGL